MRTDELYALRYGAVPIVSRVGGLKDTIVDANEMALQADVATGLQFSPTTADALALALREAERLFEDAETWRKIQATAWYGCSPAQSGAPLREAF